MPYLDLSEAAVVAVTPKVTMRTGTESLTA